MSKSGCPSYRRTAEARRAFFFMLGRRYAGLRPWRLTSVLDAYLRMHEPGEDMSLTGSLIDDPKARDCIVASTLTRSGGSRILIVAYDRVPDLSGVRITFEPARVLEGQAEFYSLQAFFEGGTAEQ